MNIENSMSLSKILKYANFFTTNDGIYSNFFFTGDGVVTTNGNFLFKSSLAEVPNATIPSKKLMNFLSVCPSEQIEWKQSKDNSYITFRSDSYRTQIPNVYISEIPSPSKLFGQPIKDSLKNFREEFKITNDIIKALDDMSFCKPSKDVGKQEIQGVRFEPEGLFATDAYGIACSLVKTNVVTPFTMPTKLVDFIINYGLEPMQCLLSRDNILIRYPKLLIIGRMPNLSWPDLGSKILNFKEEHFIDIKETDLTKKSILKRLASSENMNLTIKPRTKTSVEFVMKDLVSGGSAEVIGADNNIEYPFSISFKSFRGGFLKANKIKIKRFDSNSTQLLFEKGDFNYTILGRI